MEVDGSFASVNTLPSSAAPELLVVFTREAGQRTGAGARFQASPAMRNDIRIEKLAK